MPQIFRATLAGPRPANAFQHMTGLRALALAWIARNSAERATALHDARGPKPYRIGPLVACPGSGDRALTSFEIASLDDSVTAALVAGSPGGGAPISLGRAHYRMAGPLEWVADEPWESLVAGAGRTDWRLRLATPTAHHDGGPRNLRRSIVVPVPANYFGSWLRRWNLHAPAPMDESLLETVRERVVVTQCRGETESVALERGRFFVGWTGTVQLSVLRPGDAAELQLRAMDSLARLSRYCGTGVETMRGMGSTQLLPDGGAKEPGQRQAAVRA